MGKWSVRQFRGFDDFLFGSFDVYVTEHEIVIRGRLKKGGNSLFLMLRDSDYR